MEIATDILKKDGNHVNLLFTQSADLIWRMSIPVFEDQVSKYIFWSDMAKRVKTDNIISIVILGECWIGSLDVMRETGLRASQQPERKEALCVDVLTSDMESISFFVLFHKTYLRKSFLIVTLRTVIMICL